MAHIAEKNVREQGGPSRAPPWEGGDQAKGVPFIYCIKYMAVYYI